MSIKTKRRPAAGLYLLPLAIAAPVALLMAAAILRYWPMVRKLVSILIKLVVKS